MPAAAPLTGLLRDITALTVARKEIRRADLEEVLGHSASVITRGLRAAIEDGYIEAQGATRNLRYVPTGKGKAARAATSSEEGSLENIQITHYGARLDEDHRISKVVNAAQARDGRTVDNTITTRKATPEELARCKPAPSAAASSSPATRATSSTAAPSTSAHGDASAPAPASPSRPEEPTEVADVPAECLCFGVAGRRVPPSTRPCPRHGDQSDYTPPVGDDEPAAERAIDGGAAGSSPGDDLAAHQPEAAGGDEDRPESECSNPSSPRLVSTTPAADLTPVLGVMGTVSRAGVFAPAPFVELEERPDRQKPSGNPDGLIAADRAPTLDDVALAREQLRARYVLALIRHVEDGNADAQILDRIEAQIA